jgi:succinate-semialdehyde dehydrogenase/glutarate-semialdehyde dehydrogenase
MTMQNQFTPDLCLIDGAWIAGESMMPVINPATGDIVAQVPSLGRKEAEAAVAAAERALPAWAAKTAGERAELLLRFHALVREHEHVLAAILTEEQGKPLAEALLEIRSTASFLSWFAEEGRRVYGDIIPSNQRSRRIVVLKQPVGVVAAITPWNFPSAMIARKIAPALAAGCTIILKPAEQTPRSALALAALATEAGIPAGVLNVITGDPQQIGAVLTESPIVRKLSFTGSSQVGALLYAQCAPTIKKLSLELGGNAPFIVFDDADIDVAVAGAIHGKFRNAGQTCVCANRFYVQSGIYDRFVKAFAQAASALTVGAGDIPDVDFGPLIDDAAIAKVEHHVADALTFGGRLLTGGERHPAGARFYRPTVIADATIDMIAMHEETFGPLAPVMRFETESEVVAFANRSPYGLAGYFYARDINRIWRVAEALEVGMIGVNTTQISSEVAPFGGIKASGLGREGSHYGLDDYLEVKMVTLDIAG